MKIQNKKSSIPKYLIPTWYYLQRWDHVSITNMWKEKEKTLVISVIFTSLLSLVNFISIFTIQVICFWRIWNTKVKYMLWLTYKLVYQYIKSIMNLLLEIYILYIFTKSNITHSKSEIEVNKYSMCIIKIMIWPH